MIKIFFLFLINFINSFQKVSKEYIELISWLKENGAIISNKISINEKNIENRFIYTNSKIKKGEEIIFIPDKVILSFQNIRIAKFCRKAYGISNDNDFNCIVYFLTIDRENKKSFFTPYYKDFPNIKLNHSILNYSGKKILKYLHTGIDDEIRIAQYFYEKALEPLEENENLGTIDEKFKDNFKENFFYVTSRNFIRNEPKDFSAKNCLVPLLDLINHSFNFNCKYNYIRKRQGFVLYSVRNINSEEEITINYGNLTNIELFVGYDFIIKNNFYKYKISFYINNKKYNIKGNFNDEDIKTLINKIKEDNNIDKNMAKKYSINALNEKKQKFEIIKSEEDNLNLIYIFQEQIELVNKMIKSINKNI